MKKKSNAATLAVAVKRDGAYPKRIATSTTPSRYTMTTSVSRWTKNSEPIAVSIATTAPPAMNASARERKLPSLPHRPVGDVILSGNN